MDLGAVIAAARGRIEVDLLLTNARLVDVFSGTVREAAVAVHGDRVVALGPRPAREVVDLGGRVLCPGLIDAHVHIESSMVPPHRFADAVLPHGTTTVVCDPHEIGNVLGLDGVRYMLAASEGLPLTVYVMAPACVPATGLETSGAALPWHALAELLEHRRVLGLAEMMDVPGVLDAREAVLDKLRAFARRPCDGHAPGLSGRDLEAYAATGISSDHESVRPEEAAEKLRLGMRVLIRDASNARNLLDLLPIVTPATERRCAFCTDDRVPSDLLDEGGIDAMVRAAIGAGLDPVTAIRMATLNPAEHFGLHDRGAIAPGRRGDLVVLSDLTEPRAEMVWAGGRLVARDGAPLATSPATGGRLPGTIHVHWPPDLRMPADGRRARVIGLVPDQLLTTAHVEEVPVRDGCALPDPGRDLLRLSVIERHRASGRVGMAYVRGLGLRAGAIASSVAHDSHNIIVAGADDGDAMAAARAVADAGGGLAVAVGGEVRASVALPLAGLMADAPAGEVAEDLRRAVAVVRDLGCPLAAPFMALSFLALPVIPELKLSDRGLVDVETRALVPAFAG